VSSGAFARWLLVIGAVLCIPGAIAVVVFARGASDLAAFDSARPCAAPSRDAGADCLSLLSGKISWLGKEGRTSTVANVDLEDTTITVRYYSGPTSLNQGSEVVTEWWRGQVVALGPQGASPSVMTDQSPEQHLVNDMFVLGLVIPAVSLLIAGFMVLQSPMTADELIASSLTKWADPPRSVNRFVAWRVAWGGGVVWVPFFIWTFLYIFLGVLVVEGIGQPAYAPLFLVATFILSYGLALFFSAGYLSEIVRTSAKRTIAVQKIQRGLGRSRNLTQISYGLNDGKAATLMLDPPWDGHVNEGDRLDALTEPKSGSILRLLSAPPA